MTPEQYTEWDRLYQEWHDADSAATAAETRAVAEAAEAVDDGLPPSTALAEEAKRLRAIAIEKLDCAMRVLRDNPI